MTSPAGLCFHLHVLWAAVAWKAGPVPQLTAATGRALSHPTVVTPPLGDRLQPHHYPEYHPVWAWVLREDTGHPRSGLSGGDLAAELVALSCLCSPLPSHQ